MRDIFAIVLGLSPAVVTETLWALATREDEPFWPEEVHILTTGPGMADAYRNLVGDTGAIARLAGELGGRPVPQLFIEAIRDRKGVPVDDVRELEQTVALGNSTVRLVARLTDMPGTRIHASMAGGRKTMGFFLGYLMSLFGRDQDELSHVLVNPAKYEQRDSGFWYKTEATPDARIDLCMVPFVRLRDYLPKEHRRGLRDLTYEEVVAVTRTVLAKPRLVLRNASRRVEAAGRTVQLGNKEYALYRLLAEVAQDQEPGAGPGGIGPEHRGWLTARDLDSPNDPMMRKYNRIYEEVGKQYGERDQKAERAAEAPERVVDQAEMADIKLEFSQTRSKINSALRTALGSPTLYKDFIIDHDDGKSARPRQPSRFGLVIEPERIEVREE